MNASSPNQFNGNKVGLKDVFYDTSVLVNNRGARDCFYLAVSRSLFGSFEHAASIRLVCLVEIIRQWDFFDTYCQNQIIEDGDHENKLFNSIVQLILSVAKISSWAANGSIYALNLALSRPIFLQMGNENIKHDTGLYVFDTNEI